MGGSRTIVGSLRILGVSCLGPYNKDPTICGTRLGSHIFGNSQFFAWACLREDAHRPAQVLIVRFAAKSQKASACRLVLLFRLAHSHNAGTASQSLRCYLHYRDKDGQQPLIKSNAGKQKISAKTMSLRLSISAAMLHSATC